MVSFDCVAKDLATMLVARSMIATTERRSARGEPDAA